METTFSCSICGEGSHKICVYCTKDACRNHLCNRCMRCSECCQCDMPMTDEAENTLPVEAPPVADTAPEAVLTPNEPLTPTLT